GAAPPTRTSPARPGELPEAPRPRRRRRRAVVVAALVLAVLLAWPLGLVLWADSRLEHVEATSGAAPTAGTTYLLAGSDSREDGVIEDSETTGARTDTIMLLHVPESGPAALISLPRDTYAEIPGHGAAKINASFSYGGAPLLVSTVEGLTGMTIDHYVEVGFGGITDVVDALGGVELCLDQDVNEPLSGLVWTSGCHVSDGTTALAFARMRYADAQGDIGRAQRQQQLIAAITGEAASPAVLDPRRQVSLVRAGTGALAVSDDTSVVDLGRLALAFRSATGPEGITGTPPIATMDYQPGGVGSTVLLDPDLTPAFFTDIREGSLPPGPVGGLD
ncbi:LCP family protein, partial [Actinotalea sp. C106]|uniref:LCP family protein n=1 Tax=Actinotalea sp. C106 TaxID=2908644 RepID=UPI002028C308